MIIKKKLVVGAAALLAGGGIALGVASMATADQAGPGAAPPSAVAGRAHAPNPDGSGQVDGKEGRPRHSEVTGEEATKVAAAVTAKDSAVTVEKVMKDEDGSYHALGTKNGSRVHYQVSADLATVTETADRGPGRGQPANADETAKVTAAITAKYPGVTIDKVSKTTDGSFLARGTKDGKRVGYQVSADLNTITERTR